MWGYKDRKFVQSVAFEILVRWAAGSKRVLPVATEAFMSVLQAEMKNY